MNSMLAVTVLLVIFGFGDFIAKKTKAVFSMVLFTAVALLVGFWIGLPKTLIADTHIPAIGMIALGLLVTSMGTMIDFDEIKRQWKTVAIGVSAVLMVGVILIFIGGPIIGKELSIAAAPIVAGGGTATMIMTAILNDKGLTELSVFCVLLYVCQKFAGIPVASLMLKKEAKRIVGLYRENKIEMLNKTITEPTSASAEEVEDTAQREEGITKKKFRIFPPLPNKLQTPFILLAKLAIVASISIKLAALTNGIVNVFVVYLLMGIFASEIGFLEKNILTKANSNGFILVIANTMIFVSLSKATPQMVSSSITTLLITLALGVIAVGIAGVIGGKILKLSPQMSIAIGISCMLGFPTTYFIPHEVADAVAENEEEKEIIVDHILPKMLIAGFVTVTISSVLFAGFLVQML